MPIELVDLASSEAAMAAEEELHSIPELFMENTRLHPHHAPELLRRARALATPQRREVLRQSCKSYASSPRVPLPDPRTPYPTPAVDALFAAAHEDGEGATPFARRPLRVAELSRLLFYLQGGRAPTMPATRAIPLPGELGPLEHYVVLAHVEGFVPGVYHFNAWLHALEALDIRADAAAQLPALLAGGAETDGAAAAVITTAVPLRACAAYGERGYRIVLAEAGRAEERLRLGARALGIRARPVPSFYDERVDRLLGVDGVDELAVGLALIGAPTEGVAG